MNQDEINNLRQRAASEPNLKMRAQYQKKLDKALADQMRKGMNEVKAGSAALGYQFSIYDKGSFNGGKPQVNISFYGPNGGLPSSHSFKTVADAKAFVATYTTALKQSFEQVQGIVDQMNAAPTSDRLPGRKAAPTGDVAKADSGDSLAELRRVVPGYMDDLEHQGHGLGKIVADLSPNSKSQYPRLVVQINRAMDAIETAWQTSNNITAAFDGTGKAAPTGDVRKANQTADAIARECIGELKRTYMWGAPPRFTKPNVAHIRDYCLGIAGESLHGQSDIVNAATAQVVKEYEQKFGVKLDADLMSQARANGITPR